MTDLPTNLPPNTELPTNLPKLLTYVLICLTYSAA